MRALYLIIVVMFVFGVCPAQNDDRVYPIGSRDMTPPRVISSAQPSVSDPSQQKPATGQKTEPGDPKAATPGQNGTSDQNEANGQNPGSTDQKSDATDPKNGAGKQKAGKKKQTRVTRVALISGYVGKDGRFHDARIAQSAGKDLDPKAIQKLSEWRFAPCTMKGVPVNCGLTIEVTFNLY